MSNEICVLPEKESALQVFSAECGLDPYLAKIREEVDAFVPDISTKKGRDAVASMAYKLARSKTALDNLGKDLAAELKEVPKRIDAERKRVRELLDAWRDEVRAPLDAFEQAEKDRVARHEAFIDSIKALLAKALGSNSTQELRVLIVDLADVSVTEALEEFQDKARIAKSESLLCIKERLQQVELQEAQQAELERLRKIEAEAIQAAREKEIAERAKREAQEAASAEIERVKAEAAKAEREAEAKAQAEIDKLKAEALRVEREAAARQAAAEALARNEAHTKAVHQGIYEELMFRAELSEQDAKSTLQAICSGAIPNVAIRY